MPINYLEYVFRKNGWTNNEDRIIDEIYSFTKFMVDEYNQTIIWEFESFWDNYCMMIKKIIIDSPMWRKRFSPLFSRLRFKTSREKDLNDSESKQNEF